MFNDTLVSSFDTHIIISITILKDSTVQCLIHCTNYTVLVLNNLPTRDRLMGIQILE